MEHIHIQEIKTRLAENKILTAPEDLSCYSFDSSPYTCCPDAVLFPTDIDDIKAILSVARKYRIPIVARGGGTSLTGSSLPIQGCFVLDMHKFSKILNIDTKNLTAVVQAGVITSDLHRAVEAEGLFYPPDPQSMNMSTIGGNAALNAGGPRCFKYGVTKDYVLGLQAVLANGTVINAGSSTIKNVSGYDLTRLLIGSEGTLAIITQLTLRLIPLSPAKRTALALFDRIEDCAGAVAGIIEKKLVPTALELIDHDYMTVVEKACHVGFPSDAEAGLLLEIDGKQREVDEDIAVIANTCKEYGAKEVRVASTPAEAKLLWEGRKAALGCLAQTTRSLLSEDATVPRSQLVAAVKEFKGLAKKYGLRIPIVGHSGDGNLHPTICFDESNQEELAKVEKCIDEMFAITLKLGGTLSGEHGIGIAKRKYLPWQYGDENIKLLHQIKDVFDPLHILNPNKIFLLGDDKNA